MANLATSNNTAIQNNNTFAIPNGHICTFDVSTLQGKMTLAKALNGAVSMRDMTGKVIPVVDVVTTDGVRSRTGESCINTYLISEDGTVYFSQSDGIARSVRILVGLFTDADTLEFTSPASLGVGFLIQEQKLQNGNTLKNMIPAELETEE